MMTKKIVVLISGEGQTLQAIIDHCQQGKINATIAAVISNKTGAYGLVRAEQNSIPTHTVLRNHYTDNQAMDQAIIEIIEQYQPDLIVLAGYMKILTAHFTQHFTGKILNVHPSLLPKYPGLHTYQRAMENGDDEQGTTIHFVNQEVDAGAIVLQAKTKVTPTDTLEEIITRVKALEQTIYPLVIQWFIDGRLCEKEGKAYLDGACLPENGYPFSRLI